MYYNFLNKCRRFFRVRSLGFGFAGGSRGSSCQGGLFHKLKGWPPLGWVIPVPDGIHKYSTLLRLKRKYLRQARSQCSRQHWMLYKRYSVQLRRYIKLRARNLRILYMRPLLHPLTQRESQKISSP